MYSTDFFQVVNLHFNADILNLYRNYMCVVPNVFALPIFIRLAFFVSEVYRVEKPSILETNTYVTYTPKRFIIKRFLG